VDLSERAKTRGPERRAYPVQLEVRAQQGGKTLVAGYASVTEEPYEMWDMFGPYSEVVRAGAFAKTLSESPAVQLLLNHEGLSMAYTKAGTLRLAEDETGLHMEAEVNPARGDVRDMLAALDDGDVDEMSFAFRVMRQNWSPDYEQRDIVEVSLNRGDVSVVNFGANPGTAVALRGLDIDRMGDGEARALYERLGRRLAPPPSPEVPAVPPQLRRERPLSLARAQALAQG
jgi:HK97 family phage prohead protease